MHCAERVSEDAMEPSKPPPLEVRALHKRYKGGPWANQDITFMANPGEVIGILGPNGAGKTTLVRQITTELLPTSGEVRVFAHDVVAAPMATKHLIGVMPQGTNLFYWLTAYEHLRIFAKLRGFSPPHAASRAEELVQDLRL